MNKSRLHKAFDEARCTPSYTAIKRLNDLLIKNFHRLSAERRGIAMVRATISQLTKQEFTQKTQLQQLKVTISDFAELLGENELDEWEYNVDTSALQKFEGKTDATVGDLMQWLIAELKAEQ